MALTFNKFNVTVQNLGQGVDNLNTGTNLYVMLTNTAPNSADTVIDTTGGVCVLKSTSNANEIAAGNGYTKGGVNLASGAFTQTAGLASLVANDGTLTASGGSIGPFRYAVLYDSAGGTTSTRPVLGWWDYGSALTLNSGDSVLFQNSNASGNFTTTYPILTLQ